MVTIEEKEFAAICALAFDCSRFDGEDVIGALMKRGVFRFTNVVDLSNKIEDGNEKYKQLIYASIENEKLSIRNRNNSDAGRMP